MLVEQHQTPPFEAVERLVAADPAGVSVVPFLLDEMAKGGRHRKRIVGMLRGLAREIRRNFPSGEALLARLYGAGAAALLSCLDDEDPYLRAGAIHVLGDLETGDPGVLAKITAMLADENSWVQEAACVALEPFGADASLAVPALARLVRRGGDTAEYACNTLGAIGPAAEQAMRALELLADSRDAQARQAADQALSRIRTRLDATGWQLGDVGLGRIVDTHHRLTWLDVSSNGITAEGALAIARSSALLGLVTLKVANNAIGIDGALAILDAPGLAALRELDLGSLRLDDKALERLSMALGLARLTALRLAANVFYESGYHALAASPHVCSLEQLDLSATEAVDGALETLLVSPNLARLRALRLHDVSLDASLVALLAASAHFRLGLLDLGSCGVGDAGAEVIADGVAFSALEELDLSHNGVTDEGALALAGSKHLRELRMLSFRENPINEAGAKALLASEAWPRLEVLDIGSSGLSKAEEQSLRDSWPAGRLKELRL